MPEARYENGSIGTPPLTKIEAGASSENIGEGRGNNTESIKSPINSESDEPWPFGSQSSLDEEIGSGARRQSWSSRVISALHLSKSHLSGSEKGRVDQIIRSLNEYAAGYGKVAGIENLDSDFLIYRKFGWLHNYALLHLQDELSQLQAELERLDKWEFRDGDSIKLVSRRLDYGLRDSRRKELVADVHKKLAQYDDALLRLKQIQALKRPTERAQRNVHNLISNTQSLVLNESEWIREGPDLAALGCGSESGWLNIFLEDLLNKISRSMTKAIFRDREQKIKTGDEDVHLVSLDRLDRFVRAWITIVAAALLLVPVYILFRLQPTNPSEAERQSNYQILTIFLFTLLFSASCSIFTQARRQEVFTATAAYAAVLVVFLGNTSNVMSSQYGR